MFRSIVNPSEIQSFNVWKLGGLVRNSNSSIDMAWKEDEQETNKKTENCFKVELQANIQ